MNFFFSEDLPTLLHKSGCYVLMVLCVSIVYQTLNRTKKYICHTGMYFKHVLYINLLFKEFFCVAKQVFSR